MNEHVFWLLELSVDPDKISEFAALRDEMIADVSANEPGALDYEWFLSADGTVCHIFERYIDSEATMVHLNRFFSSYASRFFDAATTKRMTVYGNISEDVHAALSKAGAVFMTSWK